MPDYTVHPTAIVEDGATIGSGTAVWHHAHVREGASVGSDCTLAKNVYVDAGVVIGDRVKLQNNVSVYAGVELEDDVFVGPSAVFTNDRVPRAHNEEWELAHTLIRQGASIGANSTLVAGIVVAEWAMVAAGSVVTRSIAPHELVAGNPARRLGWICRCGAVRVREQQPARLRCPQCGTDTTPRTNVSRRSVNPDGAGGSDGPGSMEVPVRLVDVRVGPESEKLVLDVLRSGQLAQGPMVERFEALCAEMAGTRHAVAVSNGTVSLEAALAVLGLGPGDEVVTSPLTFAATLNAILRTGAVARFADVTTDWTMDPDSVAALVGPATAAILPVHLYGLPADMPRLAALAAERGLAMVEDAAQAHGAKIGSSRVGSFGVGSFSFYATKNVTSGEGGVVTTSDDVVARRVRLLRNQGMSAPYRHEIIGANLRMTDVQAAIAIPQLEHLDAVVAARTHNARVLTTAIAERLPTIELPVVPDGRLHVWHLYTVLLPSDVDRGEVVSRIAKRGVQAAAYYPTLVWDHPPYRDHPRVLRDDTPAAAEVARRCLSLPVHPGLDEHDLERVADALAEAMTA